MCCALEIIRPVIIRQAFARASLSSHEVVSYGISNEFGVAIRAKLLPDSVFVIVCRPATHMQDDADFLYHLTFC
jgi:hypothetical protein